MPLSSATRLGPYEIVSQIGAGGMGEVYRALDTRLGREVAIKVVGEDFSQRFEQEARTIASLNHPCICALHDIGPNYLVMEYIQGETLAARLAKGPLTIAETLNIAIAIASGLSAAHARGIVHRDLKPGNIMLTDTGAKLLDFGLAKQEQPVKPSGETATMPITGQTQVVGTLPYMSPEQLQGKAADARSDIFAFGAVLYEMLTGKRAFERQSSSDIIIAVAREEPTPLRDLVKDVPEDLKRIVKRCLRKQPEERYATISEVERELVECRALISGPSSGINLRVLMRHASRPRVALPLLLVLLALGGSCAWWLQHRSRVRWAKEQALPQIAQLVDEENFGKAYEVAVQAERYIPHDEALAKFWPQISWSSAITTTPPGASVYLKDYNAPDSAWKLVGRTPISNLRVPLVDSRWRFEHQGLVTVEAAVFPNSSGTPKPFSMKMAAEDKASADMVFVDLDAPAPKTTPVGLFGLTKGLDNIPRIPLQDYWIDKFEVTNKQFKQFLDAGGYRKQEYWKENFLKDGRLLPWAEAMALFRDKTGRPGPADWVAGEYPTGQDDFPVTGVSWFEAAAYAESVGKQLPTIYHWTVAATPVDASSLIPASNFSGQGPARVGAYRGMSEFGAYDMAGNVKEWCLNESTPGKRYIMGGAWNDPPYSLNDPDARSAFERSANFGFRCARYPSTPVAAKAAAPVVTQTRDYSQEKPVSDEIFSAYKSLYSYDKTPLHAVIESVEQADDWTEQRITFDAAYGHERMMAYLFLPRRATPPYQTLVYFPGADAVHARSSKDQLQTGTYDFVIKSGRAVMVPIYKGTYERGEGLPNTEPAMTHAYRDHVIDWSQDLGRSIDYLETRSDIDVNKLAFEGASWGAAMGAILPAVEGRIKACVLFSPGFFLLRSLPEVDAINFAPRVKVPVLMLNGRYDFFFPPVTSQEPMYRLLGTPKEENRRVLTDTSHELPRPVMVKETLDWLDRYLGPVR